MIQCKTCTKCKQEKPIGMFYIKKSMKDGHHIWCKDCMKESRKAYFSRNRHKELERNRVYISRPGNREKASIFMKEYRSTSEYRNKFNKYCREWLKNPSHKLAHSIRVRVRQALDGKRKSLPSEELLGCALGELRVYLESQFQDWMSWDNYGKWHIDHKQPCASFDLSKENEQAKCFHYTNLQPLEAIENIRKGAKT